MADGHIDRNHPFNWDDLEDALPDLNKDLFWDEYHQELEEDEMEEVVQPMDADEEGIDTSGTDGNLHAQGDTQEDDLPDTTVHGHVGNNSVLQEMDVNLHGNRNTIRRNRRRNGPNVRVRRRNYLRDDQRKEIYAMMLERSAAGKLGDGVTKSVSLHTGVPWRVVQRIWEKGQTGGGVHAVVSKRGKNGGGKKVEVDPKVIRALPLSKRTTLQDLANALGVSKTTVFRRMKEGLFRRHTNDIKFTLTGENKKAHVRFCLSMLETQPMPHDPIFNSMYNIVYIDEKWFYRTRKCQKYYLVRGEERPRRVAKSKNFIEKVMFLAATARPRFDDDGNEIFSRKIGIFPFTFKQPAKRRSINRPAGTMITKAMTSVTKENSRDFLVNKVLPAIKQKWPAENSSNTIIIQQDNAKTNISINDSEFCQAAQSDGFDIRLVCQPPNSPDLNVLDLGFFAAIHAIFQKSTPNNIEEIVSRVTAAYEEYPSATSNRVFLTQQACMREIMCEKGGQHYAIPHMKKSVLERIGELPRTLQCDSQIVEEALQFLSE